MVCAGLVRGLIEIGLGLIDSPKFRALQFTEKRSRKANKANQQSREQTIGNRRSKEVGKEAKEKANAARQKLRRQTEYTYTITP